MQDQDQKSLLGVGANASTRRGAPALQKGLDVLEALASSKQPMSLSELSHAIGRSVSEIYRVVHVLNAKGYLEHASGSSRFQLTAKAHRLAVNSVAIHDLLSNAIPKMEMLSGEIGCSCHLSVHSHHKMVVIARTDPPRLPCFSVRIGVVEDIWMSNSGAVLFGALKRSGKSWAYPSFRQEIDESSWQAFEAQVLLASEQSFLSRNHQLIAGVIEFAGPITSALRPVATLSVLVTSGNQLLRNGLAPKINAVARSISASLTN